VTSRVLGLGQNGSGDREHSAACPPATARRPATNADDITTAARKPQPEPAPTRSEPEPAPVTAEPEAALLEDEAELVAEFAEPGAEDGAGAQIDVEEPSAGYRQMTGNAIVDRLATLDASALAVVQLYEQTHRE